MPVFTGMRYVLDQPLLAFERGASGQISRASRLEVRITSKIHIGSEELEK